MRYHELHEKLRVGSLTAEEQIELAELRDSIDAADFELGRHKALANPPRPHWKPEPHPRFTPRGDSVYLDLRRR